MHGVTAYVFLADRSPQTDAALTGFPVDDAWIHLVYGRSLAQHGVPAFNDSTLEAGFSSPAWIAVTGGAHLLAHDPRTVVLLVKIAGVLAALLGSVAIARLCHHLTGAHWPGLYAGALAGLTSFLAFAQVSGMEPLLAGALALWALVAALRRKPATAGALLAAAYLARPETLVLAPCLVLPFVLRSGAAPPSTRRGPALLRLLLPVVLAAAAWALYCLAATGRPLPNTYYVKSVGQQFLAGSWVILRNIVWELPCNWLGSGAILFALWRSRRSEALPVQHVLRNGPAALEAYGFHLDAPTDERPFFFLNVRAFGRIPPGIGTFSHNEAAALLPRYLILILGTLPLALFFVPFLCTHSLQRGPGFWQGSAYFAAIGLGFMFVETPLIQRFVLYLGHPSYATTVVLGAILLGSGLGSLAAGRLNGARLARLRLLVPGAVVAAALALRPAFEATLGSPFPTRVAISLALLLPLGFVLGFPFSLGMIRFGGQRAWLWAMNGAASVLASASAVTLATYVSLGGVVWIGAACYLAACLVFPSERAGR